ncbi:hypothetical protein J2X31_002524 [Flavobacterium arsenatis]|uniref:Uncharacterized protein n=1 Tax=Flavobacterium arsenatis TaxID=1484332 RepID=A0ABU1TRK7_9FLAO|nr:hypothetical protein [Flavobacterium arsenatis]MDR6968501.1 hypothetical protein [Flavobacterium arsenatis]
MTEIERIKKNIDGELPKGKYGIIIVQDMPNPKHELEIFKQTILAILENISLHEENSKWEKLLPKQLVEFTNQLEEEDYHKDDLISHIPNMIRHFREQRKWEWFSSTMLENDEGFEVIVIGNLDTIALPLLHHQGIPFTSIFLEENDKLYPTRYITDVLTYKTFDTKTLKLKKK